MNYDQASNVVPTQDVLLQKINYMISLLEDQQDEKTNNVTEEVVLYSFLGIFIIFIVDSFAKVGKYVR
jgi:high-affinity K+ transport system ATPase subunit B